MNKKVIVFFDGHCNLCNWAVDFIMKFDKKGVFYFASLQGQVAKSYNLDDLDSVVFIDESKRKYDQSDAFIEIVARLFILGKCFYLLKIIPRSLRDILYQFVAKNRYKVFGRKETCRIATSKEKAHFLDKN
ncbi:MAG: DCC1-like thiol-disulfide oxidoreductase family protein [Bdellovibrionota bacterium]|nr:DCC1-like thiol-disulfide oxidoreductase family protein [Bdellovibrionota bacterium]